MSNIIFRPLKPHEGHICAEIELACFPPNEACTPQRMVQRADVFPELFLIAEDTSTGKPVGFINSLSTDEEQFCDAFFTDLSLYSPGGKNAMILGVAVLPEYQRRGIARAMMEHYKALQRSQGRKKLLLTCLEEKVEMYRKFGFVDLGAADSSWGGENWHEMKYIL